MSNDIVSKTDSFDQAISMLREFRINGFDVEIDQHKKYTVKRNSSGHIVCYTFGKNNHLEIISMLLLKFVLLHQSNNKTVTYVYF